MKKTILLVLLTFLFGCSENEKKLRSAIDASREGLALMKKGQINEGREALEKAKTYYQQLVANEPENGLYNNNYGWVLMKLGEYKQAAIYLHIAHEHSASANPSSALHENLKELATLTSSFEK